MLIIHHVQSLIVDNVPVEMSCEWVHSFQSYLGTSTLKLSVPSAMAESLYPQLFPENPSKWLKLKTFT